MAERLVGITDVRLAEFMGALSLATDLAMGQPLEQALCSCVLAVRLGDALGLSDDELREVYYQALLRYIGCNAETHAMAALVGDEHALRADFALLDTADNPAVMKMMLRYLRQANAGLSPLNFATTVVRDLLTSPKTVKAMFQAHCEVAERLAGRLGFEGGIIAALGQLYERWDGKGLPNGLKGEQVGVSVRVVTLAQDAVIFHRLGGTEAAVQTARERRGGAYDPRMADLFCQRAEQLLAGLDDEPTWDGVLSLEPGQRRYLAVAEFDAACRAVADFTDIKSPYTLNHSPGVAALAAGAARHCGLPEEDAATLERAGLLHDVGRVSVSSGIWGKEGPLTDREWERVRMHAYHTERVLARPATLARLGALAAHHHERLDGSGYHRGVPAAVLTPAMRLLAAADVYQALTEPRPHRPARSPDEAAAELGREVHAGRLDGDAVGGVLAAAGHRAAPARREMVAGLSERQVEVLRLMARGNTMKQIAASLFISPKTVDNHIQQIYARIGVSTRAGATLFAMEQGLVGG